MQQPDEEEKLLQHNTNKSDSDNANDSDYDNIKNNISSPVVSIKNVSYYYLTAPFIWFVTASTLLPLIIIILVLVSSDPTTAFSLAFALGLITCIIGGCYFIPFLRLRDILSKIYIKNQKKRMFVDKTARDVKTITAFRNELQESRQKMIEQNNQTKKFVKNLQLMNVDNLDALNASKGRAQKVYKEWFASLLKKERNLLHTLYDRFELMDGNVGMTKDEYNTFLKHLPDGYSERLERLGTFDKLAQNDGIIDYHDFKLALDLFAEMEINGEDIEYDIQRVDTGKTKANGQKEYARKLIRKSKNIGKNIVTKYFGKHNDNHDNDQKDNKK